MSKALQKSITLLEKPGGFALSADAILRFPAATMALPWMLTVRQSS